MRYSQSVGVLTSKIFCLKQYPGGKPRTCEDLRERYYKVARSLQVAWEGSEEGAANLTLVKHPFNAQHERWAPHLPHAPAVLPFCTLLTAASQAS